MGEQVITKVEEFLPAPNYHLATIAPVDTSLSTHKTNTEGKQRLRHIQRESIHAALALLLGPETTYPLRIRATRRLAKQGPDVLPMLLQTLNHYPEILAPGWPWRPPQYEQCSRLLLHLSQSAQISLAAMVQPPLLTESAGPVLWACVLAATGLVPHTDYEALLCTGLETPWTTVRTEAAQALAIRASKTALHQTTLVSLQAHQSTEEAYPVRLTAAHALLNSNEPLGLATLMQCMDPHTPLAIRRAAAFILATELPQQLSFPQHEQLTTLLLNSLSDADHELAQQAAHALGKIAVPATLPALAAQLASVRPQTQIVALTVLEEVTPRQTMRQAMHQWQLPAQILPLLTSAHAELRRQAGYTLAACGGEYVAAALGTIVLNKDHAGHLEAIESLRLLPDALCDPLRDHVIRWLLSALSSQQERAQVAALDSLAYLLWQAHMQSQQHALHTMCQEITRSEAITHLFSAESARVRQRAVALLPLLSTDSRDDLRPQFCHLLLTDNDSKVRASMARVYGQLAARWAIPDLLHALLDDDEQVALAALSALGLVATMDDAIVTYVVTELTCYQNASHPATRRLADEARRVLKLWQQPEKGSEEKQLHRTHRTTIL